MTAKMVSAYLTADDFQHTLLGEDEDVIKTGVGGLDNIDHLELYLFLFAPIFFIKASEGNR